MKKILILMLGVILTGCVQMNSTYEVKPDSTVSLECKILIKENEQFTLNDETFDNLVSTIKSNNSEFENMEFTGLNKTMSGEKWSGISFNGKATKLTNIEELEIDGVQSLRITLSPYELSQGLYSWAYYNGEPAIEAMKKEKNAELNVTIIMPNKPKTNFGKVKGNKVEIDLLELGSEIKSNDIIITSARQPVFPIIEVAGIILVIVLIILIYIKKRKKRLPREKKRLFNRQSDDYQEDDLSETIIIEQEQK